MSANEALDMRRAKATPLRLSLLWMLGSYGLFLAVGEVSKVPDLLKLTVFILITTGAFALGYHLHSSKWKMPDEAPMEPEEKPLRRWTLASAIYLAVFGLALMWAYDITTVDQVLNAIRNPGDAYFYRLRDAQLEAEVGAVQILTLASALSAPAVPFAIVYWERLTLAIRIAVIGGAALYCTYWLSIGTQKGIGDLTAYAAVALLARAAIRGRRTGRRAKRVLVLLAAAFAAYMVFNQSDRLTSQNTTGGMEPNPLVSGVLGEDIGRGVTTTLFYPTHGYLGLSYNLEVPWEPTMGRGASRAFDSYWVQYVGGDSAMERTYPYRTEAATGWPWDIYWATIYPWIASDLSFYGVPPFMALVGWWLSRWWQEAIFLRRRLPLLLVCQVGVLVAYIPANNQLGITRSGLLTAATLLLLYALSSANRTLRKIHRPRYAARSLGSLPRP